MLRVEVPQSDLDQLEEARLELHRLAERKGIGMAEITNITSLLWRMSHYRYPVVDEADKSY